MLQWVVLSRPIILPHVGNSPCDKLSLTDSDIKFIYIIFMYLVLLLFYLTTERWLFHQSCQLPDFLATASCRDTFLCSELNTILCAIGLSLTSCI